MNGKKTMPKFNMIDVLIILVLLAALFGIALRFDLADKIGLQAQTDEAEVYLLIEDIQEASLEYFVPGENLYIELQDLLFGEITEVVDVRPAIKYNAVFTGEIMKSEAPGRIDVVLSVRSKGRMSDEGFMINGIYYTAAGRSYLVHTNKLEVNVLVTGLTVIEKTQE